MQYNPMMSRRAPGMLPQNAPVTNDVAMPVFQQNAPLPETFNPGMPGMAPNPGASFSGAMGPPQMPPQMPGSPPILMAPNQSVRELGSKPFNQPRYPQKPAYAQPMDGEMARRRRFGQALMRRGQKPAPGQTPPTWNPTNPGGIVPQSTF